MKEESKKTVKKVLSIVGNILLWIVVAFAVFVLIVSIVSKKDSDGTATIFGLQMRFVQSASMEKSEKTDVSAYKIKSIPTMSCVFVEVMPEDETQKQDWLKSISVGDVLTFKYVYGTKQETITHRVTKIEVNSYGGYDIDLKGDNEVDGEQVSQQTQTIHTNETNSHNYVVGKVVGQSYLIGLLVYILRQPIGIIFVIIVPAVIIIVFEVMRIVRVVGKDKKEKILKQQQEKEDEILELKRQLAALQQQDDTTQENNLQQKKEGE